MQLVDASGFSTDMRKSLGNKRKYISDAQIEQVTGLYTDFEGGDKVKIFDNEELGFHKVRVERPLRNEDGEIERKRNGDPKSDTDLRDYERIPLTDDVEEYFAREVKPHVPNAWLDDSYHRTGYEINFTRHFYEYEELRSVEEITQDILDLDAETEGLLHEVLEA